MTGNYHDFKLLYRSNGGDNCSMRTASKILRKENERVVVVYRKKGT
jgi:hypothetical protein